MSLFSFNFNKEVKQPQHFDYDKVIPIQLQVQSHEFRKRHREVKRIFRRIGFLARQAQHQEEKWIKGVIAGMESELRDLKALIDPNPSSPPNEANIDPTVKEYND